MVCLPKAWLQSLSDVTGPQATDIASLRTLYKFSKTHRVWAIEYAKFPLADESDRLDDCRGTFSVFSKLRLKNSDGFGLPD
jgi:hypothetical protein